MAIRNNFQIGVRAAAHQAAFPYGWGGRGPNTSSTSAPSVSAPAAAAAPDPGPQAPPPDPAYDATVGALGRRRDQTLGGLTAARTSGLLDYGYTEGPGGALNFDPNNPFSKAALLQKRYDEQRTGNTNSYASRGQLYAGSYVNAQNATNFNQSQQTDALQKALAAFLAQNTSQRASALTDYDLGVGTAEGDRYGRLG